MSIKEIAKIAGVSTATVSRVLNDPDYKCRSPKTRDAVLRAARELNYVPNEAARKLKMREASEKPAFNIQILVTRSEAPGREPFFDEMLPFLESGIHKNGSICESVWYEPLFSDDKKCDKENQSDLAEYISGKFGGADGLIILGKCCERALKEIKKHYKNIVAVTRNTTDYQVDEVLCDGTKMASLAIGHLVSLGHKKIAYLGGCFNESRYQGYQKALFQYHLEPDIDYVLEADAESASAALDGLMEKEELPTGIYCATDKIAIKALEYFNGRKNPYYFPSIISNDDTREAQYTSPMLTTVRLPKEEMASFAIYLLLDRLAGGHKNPVRIEMEGELIVRGSCTGTDNFGTCEYYI